MEHERKDGAVPIDDGHPDTVISPRGAPVHALAVRGREGLQIAAGAQQAVFDHPGPTR